MDSTKLVIITGANKGIGYALTEQFLLHKDNYSVIMTSRDTQRGQDSMNNLLKKYPNFKDRLICHQLDIQSSKSIDEFVNWFANNHKTVYILVNNAGYGSIDDCMDPNHKASEETVKTTLNTNVRGTIEFTEKMLPHLAENGRIITIGSVMGTLRMQGEGVRKKLSDPTLDKKKLFELIDTFESLALKHEHTKQDFSNSIYNTSKAFIHAYNRYVLPSLLKGDQTCFVVHPGWVKTDLGGSQAPGNIEDSVVSTMAVTNLSLEESKKYSGKYFNNNGQVDEY